MTRERDITELDLHAYADGLLDLEPARKAAVEAYLSAHPDKLVMVSNVREQNDQIRALFGEAEWDDAGETARAFGPSAARPMMPVSFAGAGKIAASLAVGVLAGYLLSAWPGSETEEQVIAAPGATMSGSGGEALHLADAGKRPGFALSSLAPDLSAAGFRFESHDVEYSGESVAHLRLRYRNEAGAAAVLTVAAQVPQGSPEIDMVQNGATTQLRWNDGIFSYELVSDASAEDVRSLAGLLTDEPPRPELETLPAGETVQQVDAYDPQGFGTQGAKPAGGNVPASTYKPPQGAPALLPANGTMPADMHPQG